MFAGVRRRRRGRRLVAAVALIIGAFMACTVAAAATQPAASLPVPALAWQPCADPAQAGFDCATARVPLDYDDPGGSSIDLAVIRHAADDPAHRIGSLFINPGGPGVPGTQALPTALALSAPEVIARFDLVSWDPRGVGASAPVLCFPSPDEGAAFFSGIAAGFPVGKAETSNWIDTYARFGQLCAQRNGELLAHVSTADTARDLDLLRRAVGDPTLSYVGVSYGTFLGATYANLFPAKVRAMVLDANLDPVAWTNGGREGALLSTSLRIGTDLSSARTLQAFLSLCGEAGSDRCAFSAGSAAATQAKFTSLLRRLRKHPVTFQGEPVTYARALSDVAERPLRGPARLRPPQLDIRRAGARDALDGRQRGPAASRLLRVSRVGVRGAVLGEPEPAPARRLSGAGGPRVRPIGRPRSDRAVVRRAVRQLAGHRG